MNGRKTDDLKKALINAAASGMPRPEDQSELGQVLRRFIAPHSEDYDEDFVDDLRNARDTWMLEEPAPFPMR